MSSDRTRKVAEQIKQTLAQILQREVKDPRVSWVTISAVHLSRDLHNAKVYFTVLGDESARLPAQRTLNRISGFLRGELGRQLRLRSLPQLTFVYDDSIERGSHLTRVIEEAIEADERKHKQN